VNTSLSGVIDATSTRSSVSVNTTPIPEVCLGGQNLKNQTMCTGLHFGHGPVEEENAGLLSSFPSAWSRGTACAFGLSPGRHCPAWRLLPDDRPYWWLPCGSSTVAAHEDLTEMFRGAEYFSFGGGHILATSGDDEHRKFIAFVKKPKPRFFA